MHRNPALMAASLAGRLILMPATDIQAYAHQLLGDGPRADRAPGLGGFLAFARSFGRSAKAEGAADKSAVEGPSCYAPRWLGDPDGIGFGWSLKDGIALVEISGPLLPEAWVYDDEIWINGYDALSETFAQIHSDDRVKGVFVRHESPGGIADDGIISLAAELRALRADKPLWSWCKKSCSADYWLSSQSSHMRAPGLGVVGSMGCYTAHCSMAGMLEQDGIKITGVEFPKGKTDGAWWKDLSEEALADWNSEVVHVAKLFFEDVEAGRPNLSVESIEAMRAAAFYAGNRDQTRAGLALGLVDAISGESEAFEALKAVINGQSEAPTTPISPAAPAATAANKEKPMNSSKIAAVANDAALSEAEKKTQIAALLADDSDEGDDEADKEKDKEADDEADPEKDKEKDAQTPDGGTVLAILDLPEAKGREQLARTLAGRANMTVEDAKAILSAAPRKSALAEQMEGRDPKLSPSGGGNGKGTSAEFEEGRALGASFASSRRVKRPSAA